MARKDLPHIARALRKARNIANLSQTALADLAGLSRATIAAIENGAHENVKADNVKKLAKALNTSIGELMGPVGDFEKNDIFQAFLDSPLGTWLDISSQERAWIETLQNNWPAGEPTSGTFFHLIEALRSSKKY